MAFREAKATKIGGKFLAYGETGSGKSWFQLTFPNVACIDSGAGIGFYENKLFLISCIFCIFAAGKVHFFSVEKLNIV